MSSPVKVTGQKDHIVKGHWPTVYALPILRRLEGSRNNASIMHCIPSSACLCICSAFYPKWLFCLQFQFVNSFLSLFYIAFYLQDQARLKEVGRSPIFRSHTTRLPTCRLHDFSNSPPCWYRDRSSVTSRSRRGRICSSICGWPRWASTCGACSRPSPPARRPGPCPPTPTPRRTPIASRRAARREQDAVSARLNSRALCSRSDTN